MPVESTRKVIHDKSIERGRTEAAGHAWSRALDAMAKSLKQCAAVGE